MKIRNILRTAEFVANLTIIYSTATVIYTQVATWWNNKKEKEVVVD